jgi:hypothetical protein
VYGVPAKGSAQEASNDLKTAFPFWQAETTALLHEGLLRWIAQSAGSNFQEQLPTTLVQKPAKEQAALLRSAWEAEKEELVKNGRTRMLERAKTLYTTCSATLRDRRAQYIETGRPLSLLIAHYEVVITQMEELKLAAEQYERKHRVTEENIEGDLAKAAWWSRKRVCMQTQGDIEDWLEDEKWQIANGLAQIVLNDITQECQETVTKLRACVQMAEKRYGHRPGWKSEQPQFKVHSDYPLYIPALIKPEDLLRYYNRISFFPTENQEKPSLVREASTKGDLLAQFRQALKDRGLIENFFTEKAEAIFTLIEQYVREKVQENQRDDTLLDVFATMGEEVFQESMRLALERAQPLIPFSDGYARSREEVCYVSACYRNEAQHSMVERAISTSVVENTFILPSSENRSEIIVFYLVDGLSMAAVHDLTDRCLEAFINERLLWQQSQGAGNKRMGVVNPLYRGKDAEQQVCEMGVFKRLWQARGHSLLGRAEPDITEFK